MATVKKAPAVKVETAKPAAKKASVKKSVTFEEISKRAFEIYVSNGGSASAEQNWIQAEKELSK
ncbi:MAG: DUF2934 domain-containing protein [Bacteroidetes bacterium]|nr:DUF2934 domain-containing protein [Bacteroidota bacterium]